MDKDEVRQLMFQGCFLSIMFLLSLSFLYYLVYAVHVERMARIEKGLPDD